MVREVAGGGGGRVGHIYCNSKCSRFGECGWFGELLGIWFGWRRKNEMCGLCIYIWIGVDVLLVKVATTQGELDRPC